MANNIYTIEELRSKTIGYLMCFHYIIDSKNTQRLINAVVSRCTGLNTQNIMFNITACVDYARDNGLENFINEKNDYKIWNYAA